MAGLGVGGIVLGKRSERSANPLKFYGQLELLISISAALTPLLIWGARHFYIALGGTATMGVLLATVLRLFLTAVILGVPTVLMGGTLPAAVRAVIDPGDVKRRTIGTAYGVNTLGAVMGTIAGTFFCFEHFGNRLTLWLTAGLNVAIALGAIAFAKSSSNIKPAAAAARQTSPSDSMTNPRFIYGAAALVGFAFFLMELVWYRMLAPLLGGSTFSFGLILATALLGIGLGGSAYAFFGWKRAVSLHFFALTCAVEAVFLALPFALGDRIAAWAMLLWPLGVLGFHGHVMAWSGLCVVVIFPAAFVAGLQFPLLIGLLGQGRKNAASHTGVAYAWNTMGAILGSLAGGFGLLPILSAPTVWKTVILLLCAIGIIAALLAAQKRQGLSQIITAAVCVVLAVAFVQTTGPTAFWRHSQIGVGRVPRYQGSVNDLRDLINRMNRQILWETEGIESSVALTKAKSFAFMVNGRSDGNAKYDAGNQIMCGMISATLHPHPVKALVVGLGTGSTAGWLAAVPTIEKVDVVELEPAILKVAQECAPVNQDALHNPKLHVSLGDGREFLLTTRQKYDLIISEPSNPFRAGIANLFTSEYYRSVDRCLEPDGIFSQWLQGYQIDDYTLQIIYRTLGSVFSNVQSWQTDGGDLLFIASHQTIPLDFNRIRTRLSDDEPFKSALLDAWHGNTIEDFLAHFIGNESLAEQIQQLTATPLNTDDRTIIEFGLARSMYSSRSIFAALRARAKSKQFDRPQITDGTVDWERVEEGRLSIYPNVNLDPQVLAMMTPAQQTRATAYAQYSEGNLPLALLKWRAQSQEPQTLPQLIMVAECLASEGNELAKDYIDKLSTILPNDSDAIRAEFFWRTKQPQQAVETLEKLFRSLHDRPWTSGDLVVRSLRRAEGVANSDRSKIAAMFLYDALKSPFCIYDAEDDRMVTALAIANYLDGKYPGSYTHEALQPFEPWVLWNQKFLEMREKCYEQTRDSRLSQAKTDLVAFTKERGPVDLTTLPNDADSEKPEEFRGEKP